MSFASRGSGRTRPATLLQKVWRRTDLLAGVKGQCLLDGKHTLADLDAAMRHVAEAQKRVRTLKATIKRRSETGRPTETAERQLSALQHAARQAEERRRVIAQAVLRGE